MDLVWQRHNSFSLFPIFQFSGVLPYLDISQYKHMILFHNLLRWTCANIHNFDYMSGNDTVSQFIFPKTCTRLDSNAVSFWDFHSTQYHCHCILYPSNCLIAPLTRQGALFLITIYREGVTVDICTIASMGSNQCTMIRLKYGHPWVNRYQW